MIISCIVTSDFTSLLPNVSQFGCFYYANSELPLQYDFIYIFQFYLEQVSLNLNITYFFGIFSTQESKGNILKY